MNQKKCYRCRRVSVTQFADLEGVLRDCCAVHAERLSEKTLRQVV